MILSLSRWSVASEVDLQGQILLLKRNGEFEIANRKQVGPAYFLQAVRMKGIA
jgi:hypothetical protein